MWIKIYIPIYRKRCIKQGQERRGHSKRLRDRGQQGFRVERGETEMECIKERSGTGGERDLWDRYIIIGQK